MPLQHQKNKHQYDPGGEQQHHDSKNDPFRPFPSWAVAEHSRSMTAIKQQFHAAFCCTNCETP